MIIRLLSFEEARRQLFTGRNVFPSVHQIKWMNRRSQRKSFIWDKFLTIVEEYEIPKAYFRVDIYRYKDKWLSEEPCS